MRFPLAALSTIVVVLASPVTFLAQSAQSAQQGPPSSVPRVVNISGIFRPADGGKPSRVEVVTLAIYADETGGEPLWQETQSISVDPSGNYSLLLGATQADGVPLDVFASGQARWLGMMWARPGEVDAPRVRLTSVPYALRASDAATLGGKPASAYALAPTGESPLLQSGIGTQTVLPGTADFLAKYVNGSDVGNSAVHESGGFVGLNTTTPQDILHARFNNPNGILTGIAVQNLASTATSYSGMLFYDHTGALGQFQGFNNATHEYRINNIASSGSINFMIGSTSRFKVNNNGRIGINTFASISGDNLGGRGSAAGWDPPGSGSGGVWIEGGTGESGGFYADDQMALIWSPGDADLLRVYDEDGLVLGPLFVVTDPGDIRIGHPSGTTGCVRDADGSIIAGACSSDARLKKDIRAFEGSMLERLLKLRPVYYRWREELMSSRVGPHPGEAYGLIAQEVEQIYPEMVSTDRDGYKAVDYGKLQYVLLGALQEEHAKVVSLEERVAKLEASARFEPTAWLVFGGLGLVGFVLHRRSSGSAVN